MSVLQIHKAKRSGARIVIILAASTGDGKTRTALEIAYGLTNGDPSKIGFLDTENRRGSLYADVFKKNRPDASDVPFLIGDLYAPFSPARYSEALEEFQKTGIEVCIIDSGSHEWEGIGGCIDIAGGEGGAKWNKAKAEHKKFMNTLLTCDMHIILCLRARYKSKPEKQLVDGREKLVYVDMGLQEITEKNVMFEATASLMLYDKGRRQEVVKCPDELLDFLARGTGYITAQDGQALRAWVDGGEPLDPVVEHHRNTLISVAPKGVEALRVEWETNTPAKIRKKLGPEFLETCKKSATEFERQAREDKDDGGAAHLDQVLGGGGRPDLKPAAATATAKPAAAAAAPVADAAPSGDGEQDDSDDDGDGESPVVVPDRAPEPKPEDKPPPATRKAASAPRKVAGSNPPAPAADKKPAPPPNPPPAAAGRTVEPLF